MKKLNGLLLVIILMLVIGGCSDGSNPVGPGPDPNPDSTREASEFVWNAMNYWYFWQSDVPNLADNRFNNDAEFQSYLKGYSSAKSLFKNLLFKDDRFSFFIDDYEKYQNQRDGVRAALGFNYGFIGFQNSNEIVGYVRYVIPGTPADSAGLERLDIFTEVDGTRLNTSNYIGFLTDDSPHDLTLAKIVQKNNGVSFDATDTVHIGSQRFVEDPVFKSKIIDTSGVKIGYLMYNSFQANSHKELNKVFGNFKTHHIDALILDLRYDGGGALITSRLLGSLISGLGSNNVFAKFTYNQKRSAQNREVYFLDEVPIQNSEGEFERNSQGEFVNTEPMNSLALQKLYVLVSSSTASASEALINGLRAYINVVVIGEQTIGKDQAALLLFDSPPPYTDEEEANPDHKRAIQPIIAKFKNADGETYPYQYTNNSGITINAFNPTGENEVSEITVENLQNRPAIGDPDEPLLARAIALITGQPAKRRAAVFSRSIIMKEIQVRSGVQNMRPYGNGMYVEPFMAPVMEDK